MEKKYYFYLDGTKTEGTLTPTVLDEKKFLFKRNKN
jgi:hypothetical protein